MTPEECCETCRFWLQIHGPGKPNPEHGHCRRYPPVLNPPEVQQMVAAGGGPGEDPYDGFHYQTADKEEICWNWPVTHEESWCGEYQPRKAEGGAL